MSPDRNQRHAFISYVRQDARLVDRLQRILAAAGVEVWRDTANLWPGEDWKLRIRAAIEDNALAFVACFSEQSAARLTTFQNAELLLAAEQLRLRSADQPWFIQSDSTTVSCPHSISVLGGPLGLCSASI
ncbi:MAG: toll/interleukin-1 receptor domain-containing protein [Actinomycetota bacterium]|nr:toll/interleukin-1 receptor domain-containing protein [Actinomycetota bacterium]